MTGLLDGWGEPEAVAILGYDAEHSRTTVRNMTFAEWRQEVLRGHDSCPYSDAELHELWHQQRPPNTVLA